MSLPIKKRSKKRSRKTSSTSAKHMNGKIESASKELDKVVTNLEKVKQYKGAANREILENYVDDLIATTKALKKELNNPNATNESVYRAYSQHYYFHVQDMRRWEIGAGKTKAAKTRSRNKLMDMLTEAERGHVGAEYYWKKVFDMPYGPVEVGKAMIGYVRSDGLVYGVVTKIGTHGDTAFKTTGWRPPAEGLGDPSFAVLYGWAGPRTVKINNRWWKVHDWYPDRQRARFDATERFGDKEYRIVKGQGRDAGYYLLFPEGD